jgi:hypothetical protein
MKNFSSRLEILVAVILLIAPTIRVTAQSNATALAFNQFELFKNTGFDLCLHNVSSGPVQSLVSRSPRRSYSSGSGTYTGSDANPSNVSNLISSAYLSESGNYCNYLDGTAVSLCRFSI